MTSVLCTLCTKSMLDDGRPLVLRQPRVTGWSGSVKARLPGPPGAASVFVDPRSAGRFAQQLSHPDLRVDERVRRLGPAVILGPFDDCVLGSGGVHGLND